MISSGFALFQTTIGRCGIAWSGQGIVRVQLPESSEGETLARLAKQVQDASEATPPPDVQRAVDGIRSMLRGEAMDLSSAALDMGRVPRFHRQVYDAARTIPYGETVTYGELATHLGARGGARAVGQALGRNPFAIIVPCHRVLASHGKVGGFSASGGIAMKLRLLSIESARASGALDLFDGSIENRPPVADS